MSVHESWLLSMESYQKNLFAQAGVKINLPPPTLAELQLEYLEIVPGERMSAKVPFQKRFTNPVGLYQGGFLSAAIDEVFGPLSYATAQRPCMTLSMNMTFLKAFSPQMAFCVIEAQVVKKTSQFIFMRADVKTPAGEIMAHAETHVTIMRDEQMKGLKA